MKNRNRSRGMRHEGPAAMSHSNEGMGAYGMAKAPKQPAGGAAKKGKGRKKAY